jgi:putative ABC transport system permease protein
MDVPGVQSAHPLYSSTLTWKNPETRRDATVQVIGFDPDHPAFTIPEANQQLDKIKLPDVVLFDRKSRGDYQNTIATVTQGQSVSTEAEGRTMTIRGLFSLGASFGTDGILLTSDQNFLLLFPRHAVTSVSLGLVDLKPGYDPIQVSQAIAAHLPEDVKVMPLPDFIEEEQQYWRTESPIGFIFTLGASMAFVVGVVIVYQVLSTDVNAHLKEYATFKAMGYRQGYLLGIVFEESLILAVLGFIPGLILPIGLYSLAAAATALPIAMTVSRAMGVFSLTLIMCLLSGAIATRKLQSADPADMF